jgi:hypothetical protein
MLVPILKTAFAKRNSNAVELAFLAVVARLTTTSSWLHETNRYSKDCTETLTKDLAPTGHLRHSHLKEYIAASVLTHCMDGWSYLGRAINAQLVGDHDCSRHLSYYGELRAAMAVLAAHGVGVFNSEHIAVESTRKCSSIAFTRKANAPDRPVGWGTHQFVWHALEEWSVTPDARNAVLSCFSAGGHSLDTWLTDFGYLPTISGMLASSWLQSWGLDIKRLSEDRDARNLSSYRPTSFTDGFFSLVIV